MHTPTPWWNESGVLHALIPGRPGAASHPATCELDEDADFIEIAVNSHAKLLEALEGLVEFSHDWHEADGSPILGLEAANLAARDTIVEAKGD